MVRDRNRPGSFHRGAARHSRGLPALHPGSYQSRARDLLGLPDVQSVQRRALPDSAARRLGRQYGLLEFGLALHLPFDSRLDCASSLEPPRGGGVTLQTITRSAAGASETLPCTLTLPCTRGAARYTTIPAS